MSIEIITLGYRMPGITRAEIVEEVTARNAMLFDIRFSPFSPNPDYQRHALQSALGFHYRWVKEWGNLNYKNGGPIEIADFEGGLKHLLWEIAAGTQAVYLMCACPDKESCHRKQLTQRLEILRYSVREYLPRSQRATSYGGAKEGGKTAHLQNADTFQIGNSICAGAYGKIQRALDLDRIPED